jgi:hypothetical protein
LGGCRWNNGPNREIALHWCMVQRERAVVIGSLGEGSKWGNIIDRTEGAT